MLVPLKLAASKRTVLTESVIMEFSPPMMPPMPTGFSASLIMMTSWSSFLTWPSRVVNSWPSSARLTMILCPAIRS